MLIKAGVSWRDVKNPIRKARKKAEKVFRDNGEPDLVITSSMEGTHMPSSHHYGGWGEDYRGPMMNRKNFNKIAVELSQALGPEYRVLSYYEAGRFGYYHVQYEAHP